LDLLDERWAEALSEESRMRMFCQTSEQHWRELNTSNYTDRDEGSQLGHHQYFSLFSMSKRTVISFKEASSVIGLEPDNLYHRA
jgi:hypothetical protein